MGAPSLADASAAHRMALDNVRRVADEVSRAASAASFALLSGDASAERAIYRSAAARLLGATSLASETETVLRTAEAHARAAGEVAP